MRAHAKGRSKTQPDEDLAGTIQRIVVCLEIASPGVLLQTKEKKNVEKMVLN